MRPVRQLGAVARARKAKRCFLVAGRAGSAAEIAAQRLAEVGIEVEQFWLPAGLGSPTPAAVDAAVAAAQRFGADTMVGVGSGGVLDVAKGAAALVNAPVPGNGILAASQFLFGAENGRALSPNTSVQTILVPTTAAVATMSGRSLLQDFDRHGTLFPLAIAGPGPFGVGQGLQPTEVVADPEMTASQSRRGSVAAAVHALSTFADGVVAATGTIKFKMLYDDMADGLTAASAALRDPDNAKVDALLAALAAGVTASDADANARGSLCLTHSLGCIAVGTWFGMSFPAVASALLPPVLREWEDQASEEEISGLRELASHVLRKPNAGLCDLADWVDDKCAFAKVPRPSPSFGVTPDAAAAALARHAATSPILLQRPAPEWIFDVECLTRIFRGAFAQGAR